MSSLQWSFIGGFVFACLCFGVPRRIRYSIRYYWSMYTNGDPPTQSGMHPSDVRFARLHQIPAEVPEVWIQLIATFQKDYGITRDEALYLLQSFAGKTTTLNDAHFVLFDLVTTLKPLSPREQQNLFYFYSKVYAGPEGRLLFDLIDGLPSEQALASKY